MNHKYSINIWTVPKNPKIKFGILVRYVSLNNRSISSKLLKMIFSRPKCPLKRRSSLKNSVENYHVFPKKIFKRCPKTTYAIRSRFLSSSWQFKKPSFPGFERNSSFRVIFMFEKVCRGMTTHLNAHANDKKWIVDVQFPGKNPGRKWVRVWHHWKLFLKFYNLSFSDASSIRWVPKSSNSRNSAYIYGKTKYVRVNRSEWWKIDQMYGSLWSANVYESIFSFSIYKYWLKHIFLNERIYFKMAPNTR